MKILSGFSVLAAVLAVAMPAMAQDYPTMTLRYSSNIAEAVNTSQIDTYFSAEVAKRSGGAITIQHFWSNTLGGEAEIVDLVGSGAIDFGLIVMGNQAARMPFASVTNALPFTMTDGPKVNEITREIFTTNPVAMDELERANLRPLLYRYLPDYRIFCTRPMRNISDLQGAKIRSYGAFVPVMFESIGAIPVNIAPGEQIQALQSGAMDCTYMFNSSAPSFNIDQVAPYGTDLSFGVISSHTLFTSRDKWDSWPENVQQLLEEVALDAQAYGEELIARDEAAAVEQLTALGMEIVPFEEADALYAMVPDMLDTWVASMTAAGQGEAAAELAAYIRANR